LEPELIQRDLIASAATSLLSTLLLATTPLASAHKAGDIPGKEKCYGIAKAGENICANLSGTHTCAGESKVDNDVTEWVYVAKGTCKKLKGLSASQARKEVKKAAQKASQKTSQKTSKTVSIKT
jgi:uncharacterized membrane protein